MEPDGRAYVCCHVLYNASSPSEGDALFAPSLIWDTDGKITPRVVDMLRHFIPGVVEAAVGFSHLHRMGWGAGGWGLRGLHVDRCLN